MECRICGKYYKHVGSLNRHCRRQHAPDPGIPTRHCDLCRMPVPQNDWNKHIDTDFHQHKRQKMELEAPHLQDAPGELHAHSPDANVEEAACAASDPEEACEDAYESSFESDDSSEWETQSDSSGLPLHRHLAGGVRRAIYVNSHHNEPIDVAAYVGADIDEPVFTRQRDHANTERPPGVAHAFPSRNEFQPGAANLIERIHDMVMELQIQGRERRVKLLSCLQGILSEVCRPNRLEDVVYATPSAWSTFQQRHDSVRQRTRAEVFEHSLRVDGLNLPTRQLTLCTTDPLPALLEVLARNSDLAYFGRGEIFDHVDTSRPWTFPVWREVAANVPADGLPLMISVYSDACSVAGASYHPIILEPAHFCSTELHALDLMVTATLFKEAKLLKGTVLSNQQKALKLQAFNLAVDATLAWFHHAMVEGIKVHLGGAAMKLYPRILSYDGDQPELVSLVGKTCYLCGANAQTFGDLESVCGRDHPQLTVRALNRLRARAFCGEKTAVAALGMRHPEVNYRAWSAAHAPLIDPQVGGIARLVRADDLHVNVLGTVKKIFEDLSELLGREGVTVLNAGFCAIAALPPMLPLQRFRSGPWSVTNIRGSDLINFIWQCPEALLRQRLRLLDLGHSQAVLADISQAVVLAREVLVITQTQRRFAEQELNELQSVIVLLRHSLVKAFNSVRARWKFPKLHTMSAFITQLPDRGVGSTYRGEAKHRYLKQQATHSSRRDCDTVGLFKNVIANEERVRSLSRRSCREQQGKLRCTHSGGVARALTEQAVLEHLRQHVAPQHADNAVHRAKELYALFEPGFVIVAACSSAEKTVIRAGDKTAAMRTLHWFVTIHQFPLLLTGNFVIVHGAVARVVLMARPSENTDVQVLFQQYDTASRRRYGTQCRLLQSQPLGVVGVEPEDAFFRHSFNQISHIAHVFPVPAEDDSEEVVLVRDIAYERAQFHPN